MVSASSCPSNRTRSRYTPTDRTTERVTRSVSVVPGLWPSATRSSVPSWSLRYSTPRVQAKHRPRARLGKSGHEPLNARRPIVTPFLGPDKRDIAQRMARGAAEQDPGGAAAPIRGVAGAELGTTCGSLLHEVPPMGAVRQFSDVWHGKDLRSMFCRHQAPGAWAAQPAAATPRPVAPSRGAHSPAASAARGVLMSTTRRVHRGESHWDTPPAPRATRRTIANPNVYGSCARWRVVGPQGWCRPRLPCHVRSPMRERMPSDGRGSAQSVAVALAHPPASTSH